MDLLTQPPTETAQTLNAEPRGTDEHVQQDHAGCSHRQPVTPQSWMRIEPLSRARRLTLPLTLGATAMIGCVAVAAVNPGDNGVPLCWSRSVFGVDCPFCGGLRATNALTRGQFGAALDHNVVLAVALPVTVLMWIWWMSRQWRGIETPTRNVPGWISVVAGILLVAFGIVRNFTGPAWSRWLHSDTWVG